MLEGKERKEEPLQRNGRGDEKYESTGPRVARQNHGN
jgi:hypothetical protein